MSDERVRLQKLIAARGVCSRRAAEDAIRAGRVSVNGERAIIGQTVDPARDEVTLDGAPLPPPSEHLTILLHKPAGVVSTLSDECGRPTVADLVADCGRRVYPIGRLDLQSEGLLLLTNDGDLALRLTHPRHEVPKYYEVTVSSPVTHAQMAILRSPLVINGYRIRPVECRVVSHTRRAVCIGMTLFEGRNRQIREMCRAAGLHILRLRRLAVGKITLEDLPKGKWRRLTEAEVAYLKGVK